MITGKSYIGEKLSSNNGITYKTHNPKINAETEWTFHEATHEEVNQAVALASKSFNNYKNYSDQKRANFLDTIADEILALGEELIDTYVIESGLPKGRAQGERGRTVGQLKSFATLLREGSWVEATIDTAQPNRTPLPKPDIRKMLVPIGPVVVFGASNFPLAFSTAGGDTASALAAGCPVIVKSHPMHAATSELVASAVITAAQKTGMPEGVFSHLNSHGHKVGQMLVMHPQVKAVGFTGSISGGTALMKMAGERKEPIPVYAEMGSVNPVVVLPSALQNYAEHWAKQYALSITLGAGQFCTNPGLIIAIRGKELDEFTTRLAEEITKIEPGCMLHPNIYHAYNAGTDELTSQPETDVIASYDGNTAPNHGKQKILKVSGENFRKNSTLHKEVFGPFSLIVECKDKSELIQVLNDLEGQLTGTVLGEEGEMRTNKDILEVLKEKVGRIIFNSVPTGVEVCGSMHHGGPFPATTDSKYTSVGASAIKRWVRPVAFQNWPEELLPEALKNGNPLRIMRLVNDVYTDDKIED